MVKKFEIEEIPGDVLVLCNSLGCPTEESGMTNLEKINATIYRCPDCNCEVVVGFKKQI